MFRAGFPNELKFVKNETLHERQRSTLKFYFKDLHFKNLKKHFKYSPITNIYLFIIITLKHL